MASNDPTKKKPESDPPLAAAAEPFDLNEEGGEAFVDFGDVAPIHEGASGVIPLDELPDPPSGQSLTSWTAVIRRQRAAAEADEIPDGIPEGMPVRVDSPSDHDLLSHLLTADSNRKPTGHSSAIPLGGDSPSDTMEIPEADLPIHAEAAEAVDDFGDDDLRGLFAGSGPASASPSGGSQVHFGLPGTPDADAGGIHPAPGKSGRPSAARADDEAFPIEAALGSGGSSALLGSAPPGFSDAPRSSILDVLLSESNLEMPDEPQDRSGRPPEEDSGLTPFRSSRPTVPAAGGYARPSQPTQPSVDLPADADLGDFDAAEGGSESKYGSELLSPTKFDDSNDAVDLYAEEAPQPSISDSGSLEISEEAMEDAARKAKIFESSSVDLSSRPSLHGSEFDMEVPPSGLLSESDAVDLDVPAAHGASESAVIRAEDLDEDSAVLREEMDRNRKQRKAAKRQDDGPAVVSPSREKSGGGLRNVLVGTAAGLLLGAGGVFGAFSAGLLTTQDAPAKTAQPVDSGELVAARTDADTAKKSLADYQATVAKVLTDAKLENSDAGLAAVPVIVGDRDKAVAKAATLEKEATTLQTKAADAAKAELAAKTELKTAQEALTVSETKATDAAKAAEEASAALTTVNKTFKDAGLDPAKPAEALKELATKKADAEKLAKETADKAIKDAKDFEAKVETAMKQVTDATKSAVEAKKAADDAKQAAADALKAKIAADDTLKSLGDKLAKAKFVPANADTAGILKGLDDAIKAGSTDATTSLRDELVKTRDAAAKAKKDLDALTAKQLDAEKAVIAAEEKAKTAAADVAALKASNDKAAKDVADLTAKTTAATAKADAAAKQLEKATADLAAAKQDLGGQVAKLKTDNEALNRDLAAVRELSLAIKAQAAAGGPAVKPDPAAMADRFFSDGVRLYYAGRYSEAETSIGKTIAIFSDDARYHYLLGLALHNQGKAKEAEAAFAKGADLEAQGRPAGKSIDAILERIQGRSRQVVNSHRP